MEQASDPALFHDVHPATRSRWFAYFFEGERRLFGPIRLLTRNPSLACEPPYLAALQELGEQFVMQVSLPVTDLEAWRRYEPATPSPQKRMEGVARLRAAGVEVSLRIDPLFPRDPLPAEVFERRSLADFDIASAQTEDDLRALVRFAHDVGCHSLIFSALKIPLGPLIADREFPAKFRVLFDAAKQRVGARYSRNYLRLPDTYQRSLAEPLVDEARRFDMPIRHCKCNLIETTA